MTTDQQRRERVRNGSRRKRDLAATAPAIDFATWVSEHLPDEHFGFARVAACNEWLKRPPRDRRIPTPDEVRERLRITGRDKASLAGARSSR